MGSTRSTTVRTNRCQTSGRLSGSSPLAAEAELGHPEAVATSQPQTVLVVEDEVSIASFISLYLKNAGYRVKAVGSGGDALAQVEVEQPALIILDLMLPDMDGMDVCRRIRQRRDIPILMLTARDEDVDKIIGLEV